MFVHVVAFVCLMLTQVAGNEANGLPPVPSRSPVSTATLAYLLYNVATIRNMSKDEVWCTFDGERHDFCGGNYTNPYYLCIVMDKWPYPSQQALEAFLNTTDFAPSSSIWPGLPSLCLCDLAKGYRGYYIPEEVYPIPRFQPECSAEAGLLFCFMLEVVLYFILGYWAALELLMWILMFIVKEKKCNILGGFLPKVFILMTCLLILINIGLLNGSASATPQWQFAIFWTWVWIAMFLISAYLWWLVVFVDVVIKTTKMSRETSLFINVSKWVIVILVCGMLIGFCISMGLGYNYALTIVNYENFLDKAALAPSYYAARRANITLACVMIFIVTVWGMGLTGYSAFLIAGNKNQHIKKQMREKTFWNLVACIFWWPVLFTLVVYAYYVSWHRIDISQYQTQIAFMWIYMIEQACAWFVLLAITIALRTQFAEGSGYCASICGNIKTIEETRSGSKSASRASGGKSKHSSATID